MDTRSDQISKRENPKWNSNVADTVPESEINPVVPAPVPLAALSDILAYALQLVVKVPPQATRDTFLIPLLDLLAAWVARFRESFIKRVEVCHAVWDGPDLYLGCSISGYRSDKRHPVPPDRQLWIKHVRGMRKGVLDMIAIGAECRRTGREDLLEWVEGKGPDFGFCAETFPFAQAKASCPSGSRPWVYQALEIKYPPRDTPIQPGEHTTRLKPPCVRCGIAAVVCLCPPQPGPVRN